jgi:hypothetical protein
VAEREQLARYMADSPDPEGPRPAGPSGIETAALAALPPARRTELRREAETAVARTYLNLGVLQAQREQFARAAELFEQAARLEPDLPQVQSSRISTRASSTRPPARWPGRWPHIRATPASSGCWPWRG